MTLKELKVEVILDSGEFCPKCGAELVEVLELGAVEGEVRRVTYICTQCYDYVATEE
jgi:uncharacterized protein with PIN domain